MEFGFGVPTRGPMATPESMAALARQGEQLGFGIMVNLQGDTLEQTLGRMQRFADRIMPETA
jgi:hypothetical protein